MAKKHNGTVSIMKLLFSFQIVLLHFPHQIGPLGGGGYIFVDFFFILQGFYLASGKQSNFAFLAGAVTLYNHFINTFGSLDVWGQSLLSGAILAGVCRGLAGNMLGCVIRDLFDRLDVIQFNKASLLLSRAVLILGVPGICVTALLKVQAQLIGIRDYCSLIVFCILLCCASYHRNVFHAAWSDYIDKLCLPVYIFQSIAIDIGQSFKIGLVGYLIALMTDLAVSVLWVEITRQVSSRKTLDCR